MRAHIHEICRRVCPVLVCFACSSYFRDVSLTLCVCFSLLTQRAPNHPQLVVSMLQCQEKLAPVSLHARFLRFLHIRFPTPARLCTHIFGTHSIIPFLFCVHSQRHAMLGSYDWQPYTSLHLLSCSHTSALHALQTKTRSCSVSAFKWESSIGERKGHIYDRKRARTHKCTDISAREVMLVVLMS